MDAEFWHARWETGRIGFHREEVNPYLAAHLGWLAPAPAARVLVPLCGKSLDLAFLAAQGHAPVGVELSPVAVAAVFAEQGIAPARGPSSDAAGCLCGGGIEVWRGDFLGLSTAELGRCDALWDRAALIALPAAMRAAYVAHCAALLTPGARGLLVTLDYDPAEMDGPPFALPAGEVEGLYAPHFDIECLAAPHAVEPSPHLRERGLRSVREAAWGLTRRPGRPHEGE